MTETPAESALPAHIPYIPGGEPGRPLPPAFGPRPGTINLTAVREQVRALAVRLINRAAALGIPVAGEIDGHPDGVNRVTAPLNMMLTHPEAAGRRQAATLAVVGLADVGERDDPEWWGTDLGRYVAREIGSHRPYVERQTAAAVLGVTRQAIGQMVRRSDLDEDPAEGITARSLRIAAERRWPRETDTA
jgi:hypothetical protein